MGLWARILLYSAGLVLLGIWIGLCAAGFWFLLSATPQGISDEYVSSLAWPFVAILIAIPAIGVLLVGGLRTLGQVLSLKGFLENLPEQVRSLEKLTAQIEKKREQFDTLKSAIEEAAGTIDFTSSQLADFQANLDRLQQSNTDLRIQRPSSEDPVKRLSIHLNRAKEIFDEGARRYEETYDDQIERARGWLLETSVREMKDFDVLSPERAAYITAVIDVDRRTRRAGRSNLTQNDIARLDALEPQV